MIRTRSIGFKLALAFVIMGMLSTLIISTFFYLNAKNTIQERIKEQLTSIVTLKENQIEQYFKKSVEDVITISHNQEVIEHLTNIYNNSQHWEEHIRLANKLGWYKETYSNLDEIFIIGNTGTIHISTDKEQEGKIKAEDLVFTQGLKKPYIGSAKYSLRLQEPTIKISAPVLKDGKVLGVAGARLNTQIMGELMQEDAGLGITGETYLVNRFNYAITRLKKTESGEFKTTVFTEATEHCADENIADMIRPKGYEDYSGQKVIGTHKWLPERELCLIAEINEAEAYVPIMKLKNKMIYGGIILFIMIGIIGYIFSKTITKPLAKLAKATEQFAKGEKGISIDIKTKDELGALAQSFQNMSEEIDISKEKLVKTEKARSKRLKKEVEKATKELKERVKKEEETAKAMLFILEKSKKTNKELVESKKSLQNAKKDIEKFNQELEEKVKKRTADLQKARDKIQHLLDVKTQFVNQVAHDLRTPLTPIMVLLPLIKKKMKDPKMHEQIDIVTGNANYLSSIVRDTLNIARVDSGTITFNIETHDLGLIAQAILQNNSVLLKKNNITATNKIKEGKYKIKADKVRIMEVMENLIMNATKFLQDSAKKQLTVSAKEKKDRIIVSVKDTGTGIQKDKIDKIFDEFFKIDQSRHEQSSGLGLSICKRIINKHGGEIWAESRGLGQGTTIFFSMPIAR